MYKLQWQRPDSFRLSHGLGVDVQAVPDEEEPAGLGMTQQEKTQADHEAEQKAIRRAAKTAKKAERKAAKNAKAEQKAAEKLRKESAAEQGDISGLLECVCILLNCSC